MICHAVGTNAYQFNCCVITWRLGNYVFPYSSTLRRVMYCQNCLWSNGMWFHSMQNFVNHRAIKQEKMVLVVKKQLEKQQGNDNIFPSIMLRFLPLFLDPCQLGLNFKIIVMIFCECFNIHFKHKWHLYVNNYIIN